VEVPENVPLLAKEVEWDWDEGTDEEAPQEAVVKGTGTEHPLGSKGAPEDGGCELGGDDGAGEVILLVWCANIGDPC